MRRRFKLSVSVFLILRKDDQILFLLRSGTGWMDGHFSLPAGAIDGNESLEEAVIREAKEEVGVSLQASDLRLAHAMHCWTEENEWLGAYFVTDKWSGNPRIMEPEKHNEVQWYALSNLPSNLIPYVKQALENYAVNKLFSTYRPIN